MYIVASALMIVSCGDMGGADGGPGTTAGVWAPTTAGVWAETTAVRSAVPTSTVGPTTTTGTVVAASMDSTSFTWESPYDLYSTRGENTCLPKQKAISRDVQALQRLTACYKEWAVGVSERMHDSMGGTSAYETESVYHLGANKKWSIVASCATDEPLVELRACGENNERGLRTPEPIVLCKIWSANSLVRHLDLTKCTPNRGDLSRAVAERCSTFNEYATVAGSLAASGVGKCSQGVLVCVVQQQLSQAGYAVPVDGRLDVGTLQALMKFQLAKELIPSGTVRPATWGKHFPSVPLTSTAPAGCPYSA